MSSLKDIHLDERPREKFITNGIDSLSNSELMALILNNGTRDKSAIDLSNEILNKVNGIKNLMDVNLDILLEIKGIGIAKASKILALTELCKRISKEYNKENFSINSPESIYLTYSEIMRHIKKEIFKIILLDTKNRIIKDVDISVGSLNSSIVHPREVMKPAITYSASKIILLHNHPSGDPYPSKEDNLVTQRLKECGDLFGIPIVDHIIIGDGKYYSYKENKNIF